MPQLAIAQESATARDWFGPLSHAEINRLCEVNRLSPSSIIVPGRFCSLEDTDQGFEISNFINHLPAYERQAISKVATMCGPETTALAGFMAKNLCNQNIANINSAIGAGATAATTRLTGFSHAVGKLQIALDNLWSLHHNGRAGRGPAATRIDARAKVDQAFTELQRAYDIELRAFSPEVARTKNRGDAFSNSQRGITLAERKPNSPKKDIRLNVESRYQSSQLATMGKIVNGAGHAAIGLDAVLRGVKVSEVHKSGGDWMRESVKQTTGFAAGVALGGIVGKATFGAGMGLAVYAGLSAAGPVGWLVLGTIFCVSLAAGYYAGKTGDWGGQAITNLIMNR